MSYNTKAAAASASAPKELTTRFISAAPVNCIGLDDVVSVATALVVEPEEPIFVVPETEDDTGYVAPLDGEEVVTETEGDPG